MKYRKGELSIYRANNHNGMYKCTFETRKCVYTGYTNDAGVYDFFNTDDSHLFWCGITSTLGKSRELTHWAYRRAYHVAKDGTIIKKKA